MFSATSRRQQSFKEQRKGRRTADPSRSDDYGLAYVTVNLNGAFPLPLTTIE